MQVSPLSSARRFQLSHKQARDFCSEDSVVNFRADIALPPAQYAGFIDASTGRFVKPGVAQADAVREEKPAREKGGGDGGGSDDFSLDPLLIALLKKIPDAEKEWPAAQRAR
jgi:hypothetical protein